MTRPVLAMDGVVAPMRAAPCVAPEAPTLCDVSPAAESALRGAWHRDWEDNVYSRDRHLNRYPHHAVVGFLIRHFGGVSDRAQVRILELGCGAGNNIWFAAREGFSASGIDGSPTAIAYATRRLAEEGLSADLREGDYTRLPWGDAVFDAVFDRSSLCCATHEALAAALGEAWRVLKPGGKLLSVNLFSPEHPGRLFGRDLGGHTYGDFRGGYFVGMGTAHFAPREEIESLFGAFRITALVHALERDVRREEVVNAFWRIEGEKA